MNGLPSIPKTFRRISAYVEQEVPSLALSQFVKRSNSQHGYLPQTLSARLNGYSGLIRSSQLSVSKTKQITQSARPSERVSLVVRSVVPKLFFLDEPTSGLDSAASFEVISFIKDIAKKYHLVVIASIHPPSTSTFAMFDKLLLLSQGGTAYSGPVSEVQSYFDACGLPIRSTRTQQSSSSTLSTPIALLTEARLINSSTWCTRRGTNLGLPLRQSPSLRTRWHVIEWVPMDESASKIVIPLALIHRSFIKSYRDIIAYGIRIAMYMGLAVMMGTVWLRFNPDQANIQPFINAIFFGRALMSFMAVAHIPAFLEDRALFMKERANGLYGPTSFLVANFVIGIPYLFLIAMLSLIIAYWLDLPTLG
ncbi:hypothetical protein LTR17_026285 [Elasticomyces elasticus]|nr:hypothetical protein LTR17_026285 [Elasticomyces elasticus]